MKWFRSMSLATVASLGFASAVSAAGLFGSMCDNNKGCGNTGCNPPVACATQCQNKCSIFDCLTGKKSSSCATQPCCAAPVSCATNGCGSKKGLFDCFKCKKTTCATSCAPGPGCAPACTTPMSCAPSGCISQPKKGLFDCFKCKKTSCASTCAPRPVCAPVCKPTCTAPMSCGPSGCVSQHKKCGIFDCLLGKNKPSCGSSCAPAGCAPTNNGCTTSACATQPKKCGGLFDCFKSKKTSCAATCCSTCVPQGHIQYNPATKPMEQAKPMPMEEAKPLPMPIPAVPEKTTARPPLPANENPANLYYPTRQSAQQNRLGDLFGAPN